MKIRLHKTSGNLNPLPVMGREAFVEFMRDWFVYAGKLNLEPSLLIPTQREYNRYGIKSTLNLGPSNMILIDGGHYGTNNAPVPLFNSCSCEYSTIDEGYLSKITEEELKKRGISNNFIFTTIMSIDDFLVNLHKSRREIDYHEDYCSRRRREVDIEYNKRLDHIDSILQEKEEEFFNTTKSMIYKRCALVHRGLFGNYSL